MKDPRFVAADDPLAQMIARAQKSWVEWNIYNAKQLRNRREVRNRYYRRKKDAK